MTTIKGHNLYFSYAKKDVLNGIHVAINSGKMLSIVGPNGSGKSTLLKLLSGSLAAQNGEIYIDHQNITTLQRKELAKKVAILSQSSEAPADLTVRQLVYYGRYAHQNFFNFNKSYDYQFVDWALTVTSMSEYADHDLSELSGGQRQRAWIAMALAQNSSCLFLDELTTYLDIRHQLEILNLLKKINQEQKKTIIMVHHDLNHAVHYSHDMIVMAAGEIMAYHSVKNILESKILNQVFNLEFKYFYNAKNIPILFYENVLT